MAYSLCGAFPTPRMSRPALERNCFFQRHDGKEHVTRVHEYSIFTVSHTYSLVHRVVYPGVRLTVPLVYAWQWLYCKF